MIVGRQEDVTEAALAVMARTADPRLREITSALVRHLHAFVREVRMTEAEFRTAAALLTELGQRTTRSPTPGDPFFMTGHVRDGEGQPIADARVDVWHASPVGLYENQDPEQAAMNLRGTFTTDAEEGFRFRSVRPAGYPIPTDGVVGRLLAAQGRHPFRPAHVHALIHKEGFKTLTSQVYASDDPHLGTDVQFGVTRALTGRFVRHDGPHPTAPDVPGPWYALDHAFTMEPGEATLPRPPIE